jgi:hypothetical protein
MEQIELQGNRLNVVVEYDENEMLGFYEEEVLGYCHLWQYPTTKQVEA